MIRNLLTTFIPEQIKGYYILSSTIVGITKEEKGLVATVTVLNGKKITVKKTLKEPFGEAKSPSNKVTVCLLSLLKKVGHYDHLVVTIPSQLVMFKELSLPFSDAEKIRMVLGYEIEALLPFPVQEAAIDFIITKTRQEGNEHFSDVLVGAIQKKRVEEFLKPFHEAGIEVSTISTDVMGLYSLYLRGAYTTEKGNTAFINLKKDSTDITFFVNGQLKYIRSLQFGMQEDTKKLWETIKFTLQAFADENPESQTVSKVVFVNDTEQDMAQIAQEQLGFPCQNFAAKNFLDRTGIHLDKSLSLSSLALNLLGITLGLPEGRSFSLSPESFTPSQETRINRQLVTGLFLSVSIIALLATQSFFQIRRLSAELQSSQKEILGVLKKNFPSIKSNSLRDVLDQAQRQVRNEQEIWSSLSTQGRQSFLQYLFEMSTKIDRETLGLNLKKMIITKKAISLDGNVRGFEAVTSFEEQLKETKLFSYIPNMEEINFSVSLPLITKGAS